MQKLANETKHKAAKKKLNLANSRQGKQNEAHIELLRLVESLVSMHYILEKFRIDIISSIYAILSNLLKKKYLYSEKRETNFV